MRSLFPICLFVWVGLLSVSCGSSGSGSGAGGSADTVSFSGKVLITSTSNHGLHALSDSQDDTPNPYSHVNLCQVTSAGNFQVVPGTSTAVADSTGKFTLTINRSNLPSGHGVVVCVSSPGGQYEMYSLVPADLLPTASDEITTVSLDVTGESTILTLFLCSKAVLTFSATKACQILEQDAIDLESALELVGNSPGMPLSSGSWHTFFTTNGQSNGTATQFQSAIAAWGNGQGFSSGWLTWGLMNAIPTQTNTFNPVQPVSTLVSKTDPSGGWSGSYTTTSPSQCAGISGSWTATMAALGSNLTGTWSASNGSGGALSGNTTNGSMTYQVGGSGGASFSGTISGGGLAIGGSWSGGTPCIDTGSGTNYGPTSGTFGGGRN